MNGNIINNNDNFRQINNNNLINYCYFFNTQKNGPQLTYYFDEYDIKLDTTETKIKNYFNIINENLDVFQNLNKRIETLFNTWITESLEDERIFIKNFLDLKDLKQPIFGKDDISQWNEYYQKTDELFKSQINKDNDISNLLELFYNKDFIKYLVQTKTSTVYSTELGKYIKKMLNTSDGKVITEFIDNDIISEIKNKGNSKEDYKSIGLQVLNQFFEIDTHKTNEKEEITYKINDKGINFIKQQISTSANSLQNSNTSISDLFTNITSKQFQSFIITGKGQKQETKDKDALKHFVREFYNLIYKKAEENKQLKSLLDNMLQKGIGSQEGNTLFTIYKNFSTVEGGWGTQVNKKIGEINSDDKEALKNIVNIIFNFIKEKIKSFSGKEIETKNADKLKKYLFKILNNAENAKKVLMVYNTQGVSGVMGEIAGAIKLQIIIDSKNNSDRNLVKITGSEQNQYGQVGYDILLKNNDKKYGFQVKNYITQNKNITVYDKTEIKLQEDASLSKYIPQNDQKIIRFLLCNYDLFTYKLHITNSIMNNIKFKNLEDSLFYFIKYFLRINDAIIIENLEKTSDIKNDIEVNFWFLNNRIAPTSYILYKKYIQICKYFENTLNTTKYSYFSKGSNEIKDFFAVDNYKEYLQHNVKQIKNKQNYPEETLKTNLLSDVKINISGITIPITF